MNQPVIPDVALVDNTEQRTPLVPDGRVPAGAVEMPPSARAAPRG